MTAFKYNYEHSTAKGSGTIEADSEDQARELIENSLVDATVVMGAGQDPEIGMIEEQLKKATGRKVDAKATKAAKAEVKKTLEVTFEQITE